jgi:hypothetical protein
MSKKIDQFFGATMSYTTVDTYFSDPNFGYFVFQQMIDDGELKDDDYTLIAYTIKKDGSVFNGGTPLPLGPINKPAFPVGVTVHFADIKLFPAALHTLYPPGSTSDLYLYPTGFYGTTGYVVYTAETESPANPLTTITHPINPSPPA